MRGHQFMDKEYLAMVTGRPLHDYGILEGGYMKSADKQRFTFRDTGKRRAATRYRVLQSFEHETLGCVSILALGLISGR